MSTAEIETLYTPEDLLTMPRDHRFELIEGRLVERDMGSWSSYVATRLMGHLVFHVWGQNLGVLLDSDASYQCFPNSKVRRPDLSFIAKDRLPGNRVPDGHILISPDLAVEVFSPTDLQLDNDRKIRDYREAGVRLVWAVNPQVRLVWLYRVDGSMGGSDEAGVLDGEDVVPGFRCPVAELFATI